MERGHGEAAIPRLGLGTYRRTGDEGVAAILTALELGYRHLDTAQNYDNEAAVGEAVRRSGLGRDAVFVTTKVADSNLDRGRFVASAQVPRIASARSKSPMVKFDTPISRASPRACASPSAVI